MPSKLTRHQQKLIVQAAHILTDRPESSDYAFLARQLVQATLPHADPKKEIWIREEGRARLIIRSGIDRNGKPLGLPFGSIPRLVLYWITTEAVKTKSRRLVLGRSLNDFLRAVGLDPATGGGKRGDAARVRNQIIRLFSASIMFNEQGPDAYPDAVIRDDMKVTSKQRLWWNARRPDETNLFESEITLDEDFFQSIIAAPIPLDHRALASLKRSPLALDLYAWCAYNAHRARETGEARWITWELLAKALGADYGRTTDFQQKVSKELRKVQAHFPGLQLGKRRGCLVILPNSAPAIEPRALENVTYG